MDRKTLVGNEFSPEDIVINGTADQNGDAEDDTGLYELYVNVVVPFTEQMITEAEYYAGKRGTAGVDAPTTNWTARTGEGPADHGPGMSYCFGCKQNISMFNEQASSLRACVPTIVDNYPSACTATYTQNPVGCENVPTNYEGNVDDATGDLTGEKNYTGLIDDEYALHFDTADENDCFGDTRFNPVYWAGIDCSGLVQRAVDTARQIRDGLTIEIPPYPDDFGSFHMSQQNRTHYVPRPGGLRDREILMEQIGRGDLVRYGAHISIVYSDPDTQGNYRIIHAYGGDRNGQYTPPATATDPFPQPVFARKVLITWQNITANPIGFGRIKLWE